MHAFGAHAPSGHLAGPGRWYPGNLNTESASKGCQRESVECGNKLPVQSAKRSVSCDAKGEDLVKQCDGSGINPKRARDVKVLECEGNIMVGAGKCVAREFETS